MKNIIILFLLFNNTYGQFVVRSEKHLYAYLEKDEFIWTVTDRYSQKNLFEFNEELTFFRQKFSDKIRDFKIIDHSYNILERRYEFDVLDDSRRKYLLILDIKGNNLRFFYKVKNVEYMVKYEIANISKGGY